MRPTPFLEGERLGQRFASQHTGVTGRAAHDQDRAAAAAVG
jgi:hypothetical protein